MSSRGNIIFTIFGNSFITQDYTEKSEKIQSKNIIGVRYVQLSGNMDYDDRRIVVRSFLAPEIDLIWSFTMKYSIYLHISSLEDRCEAKNIAFQYFYSFSFGRQKTNIYIVSSISYSRLCWHHRVVSRGLACGGRRWRRILHWYNFSQRPDPHTYTAATWGNVANTFHTST